MDLSSYSILYIDDFTMIDPKAPRRRWPEHLSSPERIANQVQMSLEEVAPSRRAFPEVVRGAAVEPAQAAVILRVEFTKYYPGSFVSFPGLDFTLHLLDAASGEELVRFSHKARKGTGALLSSTARMRLELRVAAEIALYVTQCKLGPISVDP